MTNLIVNPVFSSSTKDWVPKILNVDFDSQKCAVWWLSFISFLKEYVQRTEKNVGNVWMPIFGSIGSRVPKICIDLSMSGQKSQTVFPVRAVWL